MRRLLKQHGLEKSEVDGTGFRGRVTRGDVLSAVATKRAAVPSSPAPDGVVPASAPASADATTSPDGGGVRWSPPAPVAPNGGSGAPDVPDAGEPTDPGPPILVFSSVSEASDELGVSGTALAPAPAPAPGNAEIGTPEPVAPTAAPIEGPGVAEETFISWSPLRRRAAEEAVASLATAAHAFCAVEIDYQRVERIRAAQRERDGDLGCLPFVARAVVDSLMEFPQLNAAVTDDQLVVRRSVHLGVALDLDDYQGRVVPVIHDADEKLLRGIARELMELEQRARAGTLGSTDLDGGTFTVTKPGVGDVLVAVPIIQRPQVAVLATDGARRRPVTVHTPDGSEGIAVHMVGTIGLSFDQRAVDATYASAFLDRVRTLLETRDWSTEV